MPNVLSWCQIVLFLERIEMKNAGIQKATKMPALKTTFASDATCYETIRKVQFFLRDSEEKILGTDFFSFVFARDFISYI